jgi:hypothetical protein
MPGYRHAVKAGIYLATMDDSLRDLKRGHYETRRSEEEQLLLERQLEERRQAARGVKVVKRGLKRQRRHSQMNAWTASLTDASAKLNQKAQQQIAAKLHKLTYHKDLKFVWQMLARFRTLTTFTPAQMRQFFYGVALTMHLFTKYNKRMTHLNQQLRSVFILVVVPFSIPPLVVLVIPTLIFLIPLFVLLTALTALNRQAKAIQELHKKRTLRRRRHYTGSSVLSSVGSKAVRALQEGTDRLSDSLSHSLASAGSTLFPRKSLPPQPPPQPQGHLLLHERSESGVSVSTLASSSLFETNNNSSYDLEMVSSFESSTSNHSDNDDDDDNNSNPNPLVDETGASHSHSSSGGSMVDTTPRLRKHYSWLGYLRTSSNDTPTTEPSSSSLLRPSRFAVVAGEPKQRRRRASFANVFRTHSSPTTTSGSSSAKRKPSRRRVSFAVLEEVRGMEKKENFL